MKILKEKKLEKLIASNDFETIEKHLKEKSYNENTFQDFFYLLAITFKNDKIKYFIDKYPELINNTKLFSLIYQLSNDDKNIMLIKKLVSHKLFVEESGESYALRALTNDQHKLFEFYIKNFKFENLKNACEILKICLKNNNNTQADLIYNKYFKNISIENYQESIQNDVLFSLPVSNKEALIYCIHKFDLYDFIENNLEKFNDVFKKTIKPIIDSRRKAIKF